MIEYTISDKFSAATKEAMIQELMDSGASKFTYIAGDDRICYTVSLYAREIEIVAQSELERFTDSEIESPEIRESGSLFECRICEGVGMGYRGDVVFVVDVAVSRWRQHNLDEMQADAGLKAYKARVS